VSRAWNAPHASLLGQAMDKAEYTAEIPSGGISARGRNWYDVTVTFHHGYARRAGDTKVASDLANLCRLVFAAGMKQWRGALASETRSEAVTMTPKRRAWQDERDAMYVEGRALDESVLVSCVGMGHWTAQLAPGATQRLDDAGLSLAATQAGAQLAERWVTALRALNRRHFFGQSE